MHTLTCIWMYMQEELVCSSLSQNVTNILVVDLDATDRDEGINKELAYYFVGNVQDEGPFHIDRSNGSLFLTGKLDYEAKTQYTVSEACQCPVLPLP